jgi:Arc/MetJ family transcription regulator
MDEVDRHLGDGTRVRIFLTRDKVALCESMCDHPHMATNLDIDPKLLDRAVKASGERTKTAAVTRALREYVARHEQKRLVELFDALDWDPEYDYKADRSRS